MGRGRFFRENWLTAKQIKRANSPELVFVDSIAKLNTIERTSLDKEDFRLIYTKLSSSLDKVANLLNGDLVQDRQSKAALTLNIIEKLCIKFDTNLETGEIDISEYGERSRLNRHELVQTPRDFKLMIGSTLVYFGEVITEKYSENSEVTDLPESDIAEPQSEISLS